MSELMKDILHTREPTLHYDANPLPVNTIYAFTSFEEATLWITLLKNAQHFSAGFFSETVFSAIFSMFLLCVCMGVHKYTYLCTHPHLVIAESVLHKKA